jgi:hypothetical protein
MLAAGIAWEKKHTEFKRCVEMRREEPIYILGKRLSWAMDMLV